MAFFSNDFACAMQTQATFVPRVAAPESVINAVPEMPACDFAMACQAQSALMSAPVAHERVPNVHFCNERAFARQQLKQLVQSATAVKVASVEPAADFAGAINALAVIAESDKAKMCAVSDFAEACVIQTEIVAANNSNSEERSALMQDAMLARATFCNTNATQHKTQTTERNQTERGMLTQDAMVARAAFCARNADAHRAKVQARSETERVMFLQDSMLARAAYCARGEVVVPAKTDADVDASYRSKAFALSMNFCDERAVYMREAKAIRQAMRAQQTTTVAVTTDIAPESTLYTSSAFALSMNFCDERAAYMREAKQVRMEQQQQQQAAEVSSSASDIAPETALYTSNAFALSMNFCDERAVYMREAKKAREEQKHAAAPTMASDIVPKAMLYNSNAFALSMNFCDERAAYMREAKSIRQSMREQHKPEVPTPAPVQVTICVDKPAALDNDDKAKAAAVAKETPMPAKVPAVAITKETAEALVEVVRKLSVSAQPCGLARLSVTDLPPAMEMLAARARRLSATTPVRAN